MDDGEVDMGSKTESKTTPIYTPEQLAAQYTGLRELEALQPMEEMQIRRALAMLQPGDSPAGPSRAAVLAPMRAGAGIARNAFATSLSDVGLPSSVSAPVINRLGDIDEELGNTVARQIIQRFMTTPSLGLYDPRLGGAIVSPDETRQESTSKPGSGALTMQIVGTVLGVAAGAF